MDPPPALRATDIPVDQHFTDAPSVRVAGEQTPAATASEGPLTRPDAPSLLDPTLVVLADVLDDLERVRIANENRVRQLTRNIEDSDGVERGFGLTLDHPQVAALQATVEGLAALEHGATLALKRAMRTHLLGPWVKNTAGIGEKQGARLLAAIGDPYWNTLHDRPRTVSELWAYCGYHVLPAGGHLRDATHLPLAAGGAQTSDTDDQRARDAHMSSVVGVAAKRARGQRANWSATAKMRAHLVAEACMKCRTSPFRLVYDAAREHYAYAVHKTPCVRCGPAGKPAAVGTPLSLGHQHARALRKVAKEVLKDLWRESKRLHEEQS
jgi:hypothetical protein